MRIERLELARYGRFTDLALDFAAPGVHLVVGPNEAGKSTTRSAVTDLLYGIPMQTKLGYLHPMQDLRVSALLRGHDGAALEVVRLKKRDSLRTAGDAPLDQSSLDALLAGVRREEFSTVFAIDHDELRAGGEALLAGKGDLAKALFESRSSAQLTGVLDRLRTEHRKLFVARGHNPLLNAALGADGSLSRARRALNASVLRPEKYREATVAVEDMCKQCDELAERLRRARAEQARLRRIRQAYGGMGERARLLAERAELIGGGPLVPTGTGPAYEQLREALRACGTEARRLETELADARAQLLKHDPDQAALDQAQDIAELYAQADGVRKAEKQGAEAEASARDLRTRAAARLAAAQPEHGDVSGVEAVSPGLRARVEELRDQRITLDAQLAAARKHAAGRGKALAKEQKKLDAVPEPADRTALRVLRRAVPAGLADRIADKERQLAAAEDKTRKLRVRHARFALPEDAAELPLPSADEIAEHRKRHDAAQLDLGRRLERREELAAALAEHRRELDAFLRSGPPPSESDLEDARARRQELWAALREQLTGPAPHSPAGAGVGEYERSVAESDETADRIRREALRVAEWRNLETAVEHAGQRLDEARGQYEAAERARDELAARWELLWAPGALSAPAPEASAQFVAAVTELRALSDERDRIRLDLEADRAAAAEHAARLREALAAAGADPLPAEAGLAELIEAADERHSALADAQKKRAGAAARSEELRAELTGAEEEVAGHEAALEDWAQDWAQLLTAHRLDGTPAEAAATLTELDEIARLHDDAAKADAQAQRAREQVEEFTARLVSTLAACGRPAPDDPARRYAEAKALNQYLDDQLRAAAERKRLTSLIESRSAQLDLNAAQREQHGSALAALLDSCAVADAAELEAAIERTVDVGALDQRVEAVVAGLSGGGSIGQLEQEVADCDPDELDAQIAQLETVIGDVDKERADRTTDLARLKLDLERMNGSDAAALAADEVERELARIVNGAQDYLRLRLAEQILVRNIEDYRKANQAPVLRRAQEVFAAVTLGEFPDLIEDTDDAGRAVLRARRVAAGGTGVVDVEAMSEGTRDQLYLALRLASLERYAAEERAMPLLLDDVLMTFDDARTGAGLRVLDSMADRFQVIVFTHHGHLAGVAREALADGRVHVHHLAAANAAA